MLRSLFKSATPTITVVVSNGRYEAFCPNPVTAAHRLTFDLLQRLGGINESVEDGTYEFYVMRKGLTTTAHLDRIDD